MLSISKQTWLAFSNSAQEDFELRADNYLLRHFSDRMKDLPADQRRILIRHYVGRAKQYELTGEQAVICFAHICLLIGDDFESIDRWDWVPRMLSDDKYDQNFRAKLALQCVADLMAAEIK
jgi:hypothetical protein